MESVISHLPRYICPSIHIYGNRREEHNPCLFASAPREALKRPCCIHPSANQQQQPSYDVRTLVRSISPLLHPLQVCNASSTLLCRYVDASILLPCLPTHLLLLLTSPPPSQPTEPSPAGERTPLHSSRPEVCRECRNAGPASREGSPRVPIWCVMMGG